VIKKDAKGIYFLALSEIANQNNVTKEYSFEFIISQETPGFLLASPTQEESSFLANNDLFLPQKLSDLEELGKLNISATAKAKRLVSSIHQGFEYVNSTEIGTTLAQAGQNYFRELENIKKADCDVANFYLVAQLRYLGIPARIVTGYYVSDRSFDFAPIAGTKHAWCEYFDASLGYWKRIDATPPKKEDEEKEEKEKEKGSGSSGENMREQVEDGETNFEGEVEEEGLSLTDEQYAQFQEYLQKKYEEIAGTEQESKKAMAEAFLNEYGISLQDWEKVVKYIEKVNSIRIAKENTIDGTSDSTLGEEWQKFFDLFLVAYRLPDKSKRMFTRQSMGDDLIDPASTTIDLLASSDDPYGFEKVRRGEREIKLPIDFSNDFLLDLTASMDTRDNFGHQLKEYQRQFVMSALYHGFEINQQLKYYAGELMELPFISNHLFSIHGNDLYRELTTGEREITMTQLSELFALLESTQQGAGNMVDALAAYRDALIARPDMVQKIQSGEMVKTLTVISDGNLWCSVCGKESCSYSLNTEGTAKSRRLVQELRKMGVIVNAIGFTENSRPVADIFSDEDNPDAAVVVDNVEYAVAKHHKQMVKSWEAIKKTAQFRQLNIK
ncbi:MAG: transglutaminase domain-containing protein, partial [Patescibacteria group bacterium]|nr:transglutaminase domain-containing protein [Patescibacteria group bacterium]